MYNNIIKREHSCKLKSNYGKIYSGIRRGLIVFNINGGCNGICLL